MFPRPALLIAAAVLLSGCSRDVVTHADADVSVDRERIDFGESFVGFTEERALTITNRSRVELAVQLRTGTPFTVEPTGLALGGGASVELRIGFNPAEEGSFEQVLTLEADGRTTDVLLTGSAVTPPACSTTDACQTSTFEPSSGTCVTAPRADGSPCSDENACIANGQCVSGACLGTVAPCDDGNACTVDACQPGAGCVHLDDSASCPAPADPCQAAFCDPITGCGSAPVVDGTACGEADCITASICLAGACKQVSVPEGAQCAGPSPCQPRGICQAQSCVQPPAQPLSVAWSYGPVQGPIRFDGVADGLDNLYLTECLPTSATCTGDACFACEVVSLTRDGFLRWRHPLTLQRGAPAEAFAQLIAGSVLVTLVGDNVVEARRLTDGALVWSRDLLADFGAQMFDPTVPVSQRGVFFRGPAADHLGNLYLPLEARRINTTERGGAQSRLVSLNAGTGATRWTSLLTGEFAESALDEQRNVYVTELRRSIASTDDYLVQSLTPAGALRWTSIIAEGRNPAVSDGHLIAGGYTSVDTTNGAELWRKQHAPVNNAVMARGSAWSMQFVSSELRYNLVRRDAWYGTEQWVTNLGPQTYVSEATLTRKDATLLVASDQNARATASPYSLMEVDAAGAQTFRCELPPTVAFTWRLTLLQDRAVVLAVDNGVWKLLAFDLPGRQLGAQGWVTERGSNARNAAAR